MTSTPVRVLALVGSVRTGSVNRRLAERLRDEAPEGVEVQIAEGLADLPFYDDDVDAAGAPEAVARVREQIAAADRILFVTPEYNGRMPAVLANVIDWGSRPYAAGALKGKPVAVVGASFGQYGGVWAHDEARKSVGIAGGVALPKGLSATPTSPDLSTDGQLVADALVVLQDLVAHDDSVAA
ncbi:NADPH-dependent FMN reductase [Nocardioides alkalitolerans]|uniref:NADPH-dependent FMN reductase n=1 Tax=Nocardioides alkalitolerans TaxID=281714 RepID=UPI000410F31E|nr:NAD(P)H-dependent oxidoreductase [Nocardioides alkalitolerans]